MPIIYIQLHYRIVKKIQSMIETHEKLKEEERSFKELCKSELSDLEQEISWVNFKFFYVKFVS